VRLNPGDADAHSNLGNLYRLQGLLERAVFHHHEAIRLNPLLVEAHTQLGVTLQDLGQTEAALRSYERAVQLQPGYPDAHWNRALAWLSEGSYAAGWAEYEWRWKRRGRQARRFEQPAWDGSCLAGRTILLYAEQGLGDTLQFIRYASLVKRRGGVVVVECQPELVRLLRSCEGIDHVVSSGEPLPAFDVQSALLSLPHILGTTLENLPAAVPYLAAEPERFAELHAQLQRPDYLNIGIIWQGNPSHQNDRFRSLQLQQLLPLTQVPGVRLYSLQKGAGREQLVAMTGQHAIVDLSDGLNDFYDTAAAISSLNLVIGCDTSVVHLAGALGVPTWVLLSAAADWRWLRSRPDSPWYPTVKLFRQRRLGVWDDVIATVGQSLTELATSIGLRGLRE